MKKKGALEEGGALDEKEGASEKESYKEGETGNAKEMGASNANVLSFQQSDAEEGEEEQESSEYDKPAEEVLQNPEHAESHENQERMA